MKLQNNFTTVEQSKRLLELGVPADSADCYYSETIKHIVVIDAEIDKKEFFRGNIVPCWSVGRLIEIYLHSIISSAIVSSVAPEYFYIKKNHSGNICIMDAIINQIEIAYKNNKLDFSKLEN